MKENSLVGKVLEVATLNIISGKTAEFEAAFKLAHPLVESISGYIKHDLVAGIEKPDQYILLIWWESLEAHMVGFRESQEYQQWKELLHKFFAPDTTVLHYSKKL